MKKLGLANTKTGISWWNDARKLSNKAIKKYNKFVDGDTSAKKLNKKCKEIYNELYGMSIDYSENWDVIVQALINAGENTDWYTKFEW